MQEGTDKSDTSGGHIPLVTLAASLIKANIPDGYEKKLVEVVEVDAHDQTKVLLGVFDDRQPPLGYIVHYKPEVEPLVMDSQILCLPKKQSNMHELRLLIANYGTEMIVATVWEIVDPANIKK